ncbi:MAG: hypothetical protein JWP35_2576 [Caulobacter sp.]|nr:hypothetical protein [Caulobacter sp.]
MPDIIDASQPCDAKAAALKQAGVQTVIRYYSRDTGIPAKRLSRPEAVKLAAAGLRIGIVHEAKHGNQIGSFSRALGVKDGAYARHYGAQEIGQPAGSAIYFGVDFDASTSELKTIILPYFEGVAEAFAAAGPDAVYSVGVYGSGLTCAAVLDAGLAERAWLAQSTGWAGYKAFLKSGRWSLKQEMPTTVAGVACDPDQTNAGGDIGDFSLPGATPAVAMRVNARAGLRLRAGPGVEFDKIGLLPLGARVYALKTVGDWTMADLQGDGVADGFVSSAYLAAADA